MLMTGLVRRCLVLICLLGGLGMICLQAKAQQAVELTWNPATTTDTNYLVTQYRVWYGTQSGVYTNSVLFGNTADVEVGGLQGGVTYYFTVQSMDLEGDVSPLSNEAVYSVPVLQPVGLQTYMYYDSNGALNLEVYGAVSPSGNWYIYSSTDLKNWNLDNFDNSAEAFDSVVITNAPRMFFEVVRY
jgi:hypothetical protein